MPGTTELVLVYDREIQIRQAIEDGTDRGIRKLALDIEAEAKKRITAQGAIDTGTLRASIFSDFAGHNGYGRAEAAANVAAWKPGRHSKKVNVGFLEHGMFPEERAGVGEAIVAVGALYGAYVEFGTVHTGARPFFGPAVDKVLAEAPVIVVEEINKRL